MPDDQERPTQTGGPTGPHGPQVGPQGSQPGSQGQQAGLQEQRTGGTGPNPAVTSPQWQSTANRRGEDHFWPAPGQTSPPPQSGPELDFTAPRDAPTVFVPSTATAPAARNNPLPLRWLIPVVVLVLLMGFGGVYLWQQGLPFGADQEQPAASGRVLNRTAPPGWTTELAWYRDIATTPAVAVAQNRVAFFEDGRLTVLDADSGMPEFSSRPLELSPNAQPLLSRVDGLPVVGVLDGSNLTLWQLPAPDGAAGTRISLALNAQVFTQSGGILVSTRDQQWSVSNELTLTSLKLPADHVALGVTGEGELLSAPATDSWTFTGPGRERTEVRVQDRPEGTEGPMQVAWSSRGVVVAWGTMSDPGRRTVGFYDTREGTLLAEGTLSAQQVADGLPLTVAEHADFASAGPLLADLGSGTVHTAPGWSTVMSNNHGLYGTVNGSRQFWNGQDEPVELEPGTGVPWGVSNSGLAIVMDTADSGEFTLGALRPEVPPK